MNKKTMDFAGSWAFIVGIVIAIIAGFWPLSTMVSSLLIVLGLVVGFLNVTGKESLNFVLLTTALVVISSMGGNVLSGIQYVGSYVSGIMTSIINFVVPATIVVILKGVYGLAAKD